MDAVILGGGDVKGAFGAAALEVLASEGCRIGRVVGASSGALNAVVFAAGVRFGCAREAAGVAVELWRDAAHWGRFLDIDLAAVVSARGLSDSGRVEDLIRRAIDQLPRGQHLTVELKIVVTLLNGTVVHTAIGDATTFEGVLRFTGADFDSNDGVASAVRAAVASAAFPGLFAPVHLDERGPALDGGMVSNAPLTEAIDDEVDRVFVILPFPTVQRAHRQLGGVALLGHIVEVLTQERLFRDLASAENRNAALVAINGLVEMKTLSAQQRNAVHDAIGWRSARPVEIVAIRPEAPLPGSAFAGFFDAGLRREYIEAGRLAAVDALRRATRKCA